jgi:glycerophosphoryl diester phosphodiesterase
MSKIESPRILGHRGTQEKFTENGIKAFEYSLANGVTGFETDFHLTADGVVVAMHDYDIKRTSTGEGVVETMTLAELKSFKLKSSDETIPTADELFALFENRRDFYIELELKARYGEYYDESRMDDYINKLYASAANRLSNGTYIFTCFDIDILKRVKHLHPSAKTGYITGAVTQAQVDAAVDARCYCISPTLDGTEQALVDAAKAAGLKVNLWHSETLELWKKARDMGADFSTNNYPVTVLKAVREAGLA